MMPSRATLVAGRRGFALLTVLWVLVGASLLSLQVSRTSRESIGTAGNRIGNRRAAWVAEGCLATLRAAIDERLALADDVERVWSALDDSDGTVGDTSECETRLSPTGTSLDVNAAPRDRLATLLGAAGMTRGAADSLADAISDWRDHDGDVRPDGAEAEWYISQQRSAPRDSSFASRAELGLVRGWTSALDSLNLLGVESDALLLSRASPMVLAALPGWDAEAVARAVEMRAQGAIALPTLLASLSPESRARIVSALGGPHRVTVVPEAWIAMVVAMDPVSRVRTGIEVRLARSGRRAAVLRHRTMPWQ